jgi:diguanylate cyclase (GGDEF)-like protein
MLSGVRHSEALGVPLESVFAAGGRQRGLRLNRELVRRCVREDRMLTFNEALQLRGGASGEAWVQCSLSPVRDNLGKAVGTVIILRDVSEQRRQAEQAQYDSSHDPATGLINRREFERGLRNLVEQTQKKGGEHVLLMIDIDHFKLLNQTCGRASGDQVLGDVSRLIEQCIRGDDTLARFGGDEFALILQRCGLEAATVVARKICARVDEYVFLHEGQKLRLGASIGLAVLDQGCKGLTDILKEADSACYVAQKAGGGRVQAYIERDVRVKTHKTVVNWASSCMASASAPWPVAAMSRCIARCCCACPTSMASWPGPVPSCRRRSATISPAVSTAGW